MWQWLCCVCLSSAGMMDMGAMSNPAMQDFMLQMMDSPAVQEQMRTVMSNPELFRSMVMGNPMVAGNPAMQQQMEMMLQNPAMMQMVPCLRGVWCTADLVQMMDPAMIRMSLQMQRTMYVRSLFDPRTC